MRAHSPHTAQLSLWANTLVGTIPSELRLLSRLKVLYLDVNRFTGTIPTDLGLLSNLEELSMSSCQLIGTVPTNLASLSLLSKSQFLMFQSLLPLLKLRHAHPPHYSTTVAQ